MNNEQNNHNSLRLENVRQNRCPKCNHLTNRGELLQDGETALYGIAENPHGKKLEQNVYCPACNSSFAVHYKIELEFYQSISDYE